MTLHSPKLPTLEEFASLLEIAASAPDVTIPAAHLNRLVVVQGPLVTGDGLIRITESV